MVEPANSESKQIAHEIIDKSYGFLIIATDGNGATLSAGAGLSEAEKLGLLAYEKQKWLNLLLKERVMDLPAVQKK